MNDKERWRDVVGYEGLYQVSNHGRVRSVRQIRKPIQDKRDGKVVQLVMTLSKDNVVTTVGIHRLVLIAWVGPPPDGYEGCHKDGNPTNNSVSNLYWGTRADNVNDTLKHGTACVRRVRRSDGMEYDSIADAGRRTGCKAQSIWKACKGINKTAGGYGWHYID